MVIAPVSTAGPQPVNMETAASSTFSPSRMASLNREYRCTPKSMPNPTITANKQEEIRFSPQKPEP